jgi:hypothetical protein
LKSGGGTHTPPSSPLNPCMGTSLLDYKRGVPVAQPQGGYEIGNRGRSKPGWLRPNKRDINTMIIACEKKKKRECDRRS